MLSMIMLSQHDLHENHAAWWPVASAWWSCFIISPYHHIIRSSYLYKMISFFFLLLLIPRHYHTAARRTIFRPNISANNFRRIIFRRNFFRREIFWREFFRRIFFFGRPSGGHRNEKSCILCMIIGDHAKHLAVCLWASGWLCCWKGWVVRFVLPSADR